MGRAETLGTGGGGEREIERDLYLNWDASLSVASIMKSKAVVV